APEPVVRYQIATSARERRGRGRRVRAGRNARAQRVVLVSFMAQVSRAARPAASGGAPSSTPELAALRLASHQCRVARLDEAPHLVVVDVRHRDHRPRARAVPEEDLRNEDAAAAVCGAPAPQVVVLPAVETDVLGEGAEVEDL